MSELTLANTALAAKVKKLEEGLSRLGSENARLEKHLQEAQGTSERGLDSVAEKSKIIQNLKSEIGDLSEQNEALRRKLLKLESEMKQSQSQGPKYTDEYKQLQHEYIKSKQ